MVKIERAISQMEEWALDDIHGYDQRYRWGQYGDYDCSSAVIQAWENAGVPVKTAGASYTGNIPDVFPSFGFKNVISSVNLATGSGLKRGDVLLNRWNHVAMYCGNGKEVEASINEFGGITGGQPGDQTGQEFLIRSYRNYPNGGWTHIYRYMNDTEETETKQFSFTTKEIKEGDVGIHVWRLKMILKARGYYIWLIGSTHPTKMPFTKGMTTALNKWLKKAGFKKNGVCDNQKAWPTLLGLPRKNGRWYVEECRIGMMGNKSVLLYQEILKSSGYYKGSIDWNFGPKMQDGVIKFQKAVNKTGAKIRTDGVVDYETAKYIIGNA